MAGSSQYTCPGMGESCCCSSRLHEVLEKHIGYDSFLPLVMNIINCGTDQVFELPFLSFGTVLCKVQSFYGKIRHPTL